ncbi:SETMAR [Cordylochernes scorpioides]|uniref:SETMAR n=1 Tax=Cordylochernes scorpioides TaxID=51811 RepID=A0ABY6LAC1_9ARAC|nr:SETMAR [Cordylochernes scorpioides]
MDEFHISLIWTKNLTVFGFQRPHTSCKTVSTIIKLGFEVLEHPAYSPDLAPFDYFLFGLLKKELKGKRFDSDEDVQKVVQDFFTRFLRVPIKRVFTSCQNDGDDVYRKPRSHDEDLRFQSETDETAIYQGGRYILPLFPRAPKNGEHACSFRKIQIVENFWSPWIMAISERKSAHLREVLLFAFNWKKSAIEAHRMLEEVYGDYALSKSQCYRWFKKFQSGDFELDNEPRGKPPQKFEDAELQALLDEDSTQTQEKLSKQLQVSQGAVSLCLNSLGMTQNISRWIWIPFSNPTRQKLWGLPGQFPKQTPKPNRFGKKAMLCIWWDQTGIVYFELLKPGETVNTSRYEQQMHSLREALNEKRPEWREKHNKLILQHDNAPAHNATVVKNTIKDLGWELLPHPLYSPDLAPSDYHLFTSLGHALKNQEFSNSDILRKWLVDWFDSKGIEFFRQGIRKLPERWSECIANQGNYFE